VSAAPNTMTAAPAFDWTEVNCFLRPQYLACQALAPDYGDLFLFLASQGRAHALRPAVPDAYQHGADSHGAFCELTGVEFRVMSPPGVAEVLSCVKQALADGPVILPVASRHLNYLPAPPSSNELHHVTLQALDRANAGFVALDNFAFHQDPKSVVYDQVAITETALERAIVETWSAGDVASGKGCWILQIRRGASFVERRPATAWRLVIDEYRRLGEGGSVGKLLPIEELQLAELRKAASTPGGNVAPLVREYLRDCNFSGVHLRLAAHALERVEGELNAGLQVLTERALTLARSTRTSFLVNCLSAAMTDEDWMLLGARLADIMGPLQRRLTIAAGAQA
jgi:hypothetical protein